MDSQQPLHPDSVPHLTETADSYNSEIDRVLTNNQAEYQVGAATERQTRDRMVAAWQNIIATQRDQLHSFLKMLGNGDPHMVHKAIDALDRVAQDMGVFLDHAGGRRK